MEVRLGVGWRMDPPAPDECDPVGHFAYRGPEFARDGIEVVCAAIYSAGTGILEVRFAARGGPVWLRDGESWIRGHRAEDHAPPKGMWKRLRV
jgi:hypothetical protein